MFYKVFRSTAVLSILLPITLMGCANGIPIKMNGKTTYLFARGGNSGEAGPQRLTSKSAAQLQSAAAVQKVNLQEQGISSVQGTPQTYDLQEKDLGLQCGSSPANKITSVAPISFELNSPPADLEVYLKSESEGLLSHPDGKFYCVGNKRGKPINSASFQWSEGSYSLYLFNKNTDPTGNAALQFISPSKVLQTLDQYFPQHIDLDSSANPVFATTRLSEDTPQLDGKLLGCPQRSKRLIPVTTVAVKSPSTFTLKASEKRKLYLFTEDQQCIPAPKELPVGTHQLWAQAPPQDLEEIDIFLQDNERPVKFDDLPEYTYNTKKTQTVLASQKAQHLDVEGLCGYAVGAPNFLVRIPSTQQEDIPLTHLDGNKRLAVYGPIDGDIQDKNNCHRDNIPRKQGTYAVYMLHVNSDSDQEVAISIGPTDRVDPFEVIRPLPKDPSISERQITSFYGYYFASREYKRSIQIGHFPVEPLFSKVPKQLFVFAKEARNGVLANEPLLVMNTKKDQTTVLRVDGSEVDVRTEMLSTTPSGAIELPTLEIRLEPTWMDQAIRIAGPVEQPTIDKYHKRLKKFEKCVTKWLKKNDPTWDKDYDLINLKTGESLRDIKSSQAGKVCNASSLDKEDKKLAKKIYKARLAQQKNVVKSLQKRFK